MSKHVHLIGIGGIGMSGIARLLLEEGIQVSGCDLKSSLIIQQLQDSGVKVYFGHDPCHLEGVDELVYSSAIRNENPELKFAYQRGIRILKRAEALANLMGNRKVVAVTGSHGKTTTASLCACLLLAAGLKPAIAVGGVLRNLDTNAYFGQGEYFVAEADESDGSLLYYRPFYSIITNLDYEHLDHYGSFENLLEVTKEFMCRTESRGSIFCCYDDKNLRNLKLKELRKVVFFGLDKNADVHAERIKLSGLTSQFECVCQGKKIDDFFLPLGGKHNISNALAVIALGLEMGIDIKIIKETLANYKGSGRRIELKYSDGSYTIIDDYAHHPTEIKATLSAVRNLNPKGRLIVMFQPHRFTRIKYLQDRFAPSFSKADLIILTEIYSANESPIEGVSGEALFERIKKAYPGKKILFIPEKEKLVPSLMNLLSPGDVILTMGAGDITRICDDLVQQLKRKG